MPSPRIPGLRLLHSPGPTHVPDEVVHAMSRQPTDLADPRLADLVAACESGMKSLLGSNTAEVFFYAANGHGGWEAVISNLVAPGAQVLVPGTGHFSDNWAEQVEAFGGVALRTPYRDGHPIDPAAVEAALRDDRSHRIGAVFVVHTDTASGTTCDLAAIRGAIDAARHPALLVVDVVASLAAAPFAMDAVGADVAIGASQKGLMVQPGLAFVAANARALEAAEHNPVPRFYWDWQRRRSNLSYRKFCGTPPLAHIAGLEAALGLIAAEGLANVHARHARLAHAVHAAVTRWSEGGALALFTKVPEARSVSVTAIEAGPGIDPEALRTLTRERFQVAIAGGLGPLHGRVFRIGHLGDVNEAMILGCLAGVEAGLKVMGVACGSGVDAAVTALIESAR
ncbi:MAG TPA: aminotransferase class V-fold PLP-dependent enzyme [Caldimonas sp.]|nr:aminotransferase class V-fold PLP-dependent enzyme [Caldimonas sp.]HEX4233066.1 aminotransferase class V-fold PLP-dependent enzyme [Caldimonas sp.]